MYLSISFILSENFLSLLGVGCFGDEWLGVKTWEQFKADHSFKRRWVNYFLLLHIINFMQTITNLFHKLIINLYSRSIVHAALLRLAWRQVKGLMLLKVFFFFITLCILVVGSTGDPLWDFQTHGDDVWFERMFFIGKILYRRKYYAILNNRVLLSKNGLKPDQNSVKTVLTQTVSR